MKNSKKTKQKIDIEHVGTHNPADEGLDHNARTGTEKDLNDSYIQKQESEGGRGVDNEETSEADEGATETT